MLSGLVARLGCPIGCTGQDCSYAWVQAEPHKPSYTLACASKESKRKAGNLRRPPSRESSTRARAKGPSRGGLLKRTSEQPETLSPTYMEVDCLCKWRFYFPTVMAHKVARKPSLSQTKEGPSRPAPFTRKPHKPRAKSLPLPPAPPGRPAGQPAYSHYSL